MKRRPSILKKNLRSFRAALTLIELMVTLAVMTLMAGAVAAAFVAGLDVERHHQQNQREQDQTSAMERHIAAYIEGVQLSASATDRTTYFIGDNVGDTLSPIPQTGNAAGGAQGAPPSLNQNGSNNTNNNSEDLGCTRLTFTTTAPAIPIRTRNDSNDFETQYQKYGPIGGTAEVSLATTAEGDSGDKNGLFERVQRPSDGDPSQGGQESLLTPNVQEIGFQFWDGTTWVDTWNTVTGVQRRLPAAVQVSYRLSNDPQNALHRFIVRIPASDVTAQNPMSNAVGSTSGTGGGT